MDEMGSLKNNTCGITYLLVLLMIVISGCLDKPETDISAERIYTSYVLTYDEENDQTFARTIFSADTRAGWRQELTGSAKITCNGVELRYNEEQDEYLIIFDGFESLGQFIYDDKLGDSYINTVELELIGYPSGLDSIKITEDFELQWVGETLKENEYVSLSFEEESLGVVGLYQENEVGANSITVPRTELVKLGLGSIKIRLAWEKYSETDVHPGSGGEILASTVLQPFDVVIY